jgi:hypothetical protein
MLMFVLNILLYNPLLTLINERNEYVLDNLNKASEMTLAAKELNIKYDSELILTKKEANLDFVETCEYQQRGNNPQPKMAILILLTKTWLLREKSNNILLEIPFDFPMGSQKKGLRLNLLWVLKVSRHRHLKENSGLVVSNDG